MAFNFDELLKQENEIESTLAHKSMLVYSTNNTGKSYVCSRLFDKRLYLALEAGDSCVTQPKKAITTWSQFKEVVTDLTKAQNLKKRREQIDCVIIDPVDNLVELSEKAVCNQFGVRDLSEITGRENGYKIARSDFKDQINKLELAGYFIIYVAHQQIIEEIDGRTGESYNFIIPKGSENPKSSMALIRDLADWTIWLQPHPVDSETLKVVPSTAICVRTKNAFCRSRFDIQPIVNPFTPQGMRKALEESIERTAQNEGLKLVEEFESKYQSYNKEDYIEMITPYLSVLYEKCPDDVSDICTSELGTKKISEADDTDLVALDNIYNKLVTKAVLLGIEV